MAPHQRLLWHYIFESSVCASHSCGHNISEKYIQEISPNLAQTFTKINWFEFGGQRSKGHGCPILMNVIYQEHLVAIFFGLGTNIDSDWWMSWFQCGGQWSQRAQVCFILMTAISEEHMGGISSNLGHNALQIVSFRCLTCTISQNCLSALCILYFVTGHYSLDSYMSYLRFQYGLHLPFLKVFAT